MNMISAGRKTWCQRIKAAIILEGVILLMAAFLLWENTAGTGGKTVTATSDGTIRWVEMCIRDRGRPDPKKCVWMVYGIFSCADDVRRMDRHTEDRRVIA